MTFTLNKLVGNQGSAHRRMRVGRGIGSGKGKTCGRGGKGQTARSGVAIKGFEGGQTPIHRRLPKRGFNNFSAKVFEVVSLSDIQNAIDAGKLQAAGINADTLKAAGLTKNRLTGIKLLGGGELKSKIEISVCKASESAKAAVEKAGGKILMPSGKVYDTKEEKEAKKAERKEVRKTPKVKAVKAKTEPKAEGVKSGPKVAKAKRPVKAKSIKPKAEKK